MPVKNIWRTKRKGRKLNRKTVGKVGIAIVILYVTYRLLPFMNLQTIRDWVSSFGTWADAVYILLFAVLPIFFFPVPVLALAAGILFGIGKGTLYTVIGAAINSTIMFYLGRYAWKDSVHRLLVEKVKPAVRDRLLVKNQTSLTVFFFVMRLIPLVSYNLINYVAGITEISFWRYFLTTVIGIIPGTVVFLNAGDKSLDMKSPAFLLSIVLVVLLIVVSGWITKIYFKRSARGNDHHSDVS